HKVINLIFLLLNVLTHYGVCDIYERCLARTLLTFEGRFIDTWGAVITRKLFFIIWLCGFFTL
ncbi:hypothetical protein CGH44_25610, partial [Vibrio parahaemolyticus]